jgi:hypothetical protein
MVAKEQYQLTQEQFDVAVKSFISCQPEWTRHAEGFLGRKLITTEGMSIDYHVVYHVSFRVPCLYFVCYEADGSVIDVTKDKRLILPRLDVVSQQLHPVIQIPFWFVHPCDTMALLENLRGGQELELEGYLDAWLSLIGPFAGYEHV